MLPCTPIVSFVTTLIANTITNQDEVVYNLWGFNSGLIDTFTEALGSIKISQKIRLALSMLISYLANALYLKLPTIFV